MINLAELRAQVACAADDRALPDCTVATASVNVAYWSLMSMFALYAGFRRYQIRQRFGIPGSECGDYASWLCCPTLALCQETRTLAANNVEDGVWLGSSPQASPAVQRPGAGYPSAAFNPAAFASPRGGFYSPVPSAPPPPFAPLPAELAGATLPRPPAHQQHPNAMCAQHGGMRPGADGQVPGSFYVPRKQ